MSSVRLRLDPLTLWRPFLFVSVNRRHVTNTDTVLLPDCNLLCLGRLRAVFFQADASANPVNSEPGIRGHAGGCIPTSAASFHHGTVQRTHGIGDLSVRTVVHVFPGPHVPFPSTRPGI